MMMFILALDVLILDETYPPRLLVFKARQVVFIPLSPWRNADCAIYLELYGSKRATEHYMHVSKSGVWVT